MIGKFVEIKGAVGRWCVRRVWREAGVASVVKGGVSLLVRVAEVRVVSSLVLALALVGCAPAFEGERCEGDCGEYSACPYCGEGVAR